LNSNKEELTTKEWTRFIDSVSNQKPSFFITGGEPFIRKDIFEILGHMSKRKLPFGIVTNGTLLDKRRMERLAELGTENIFFSLHGTRDKHDGLVGKRGAFDSIVENIRFLADKRHRPLIIINYVADKKNISDLDDIIELCRHIGIDFFRVQHNAFLLPKDVKEQDEFSLRHFGRKIGILNNFLGKYPDIGKELIDAGRRKQSFPACFQPYLSEKETMAWYSASTNLDRACPIVWLTSTVQPNGDIIPCCYYDHPVGNIREQQFSEIWNSKNYVDFRLLLKKKLFPACRRCTRL
jgi:MoaA/NifB/PqqE/SkfB family radical SAM enzyme